MGIESFYFDTYAFYEIITGNSKYRKYTKDICIVTTVLNLMELYYGLLIRKGKETADFYFDKFLRYAVDVDNATVKQAMIFKAENKKKNLSYVDCVGYMLARKRNIKFLTGDKEFSDFQGVEFVK